MERIGIVGAGAAAVAAAETLRREGFQGSLTVFGQEAHAPYDRPPLSKQVLAGDWEPERTALRPDDSFARQEIELVLGNAVVALELLERRLTFADGSERTADGIVICTGVQPRRLAQGHELAGVHVLRSIDDSLQLRAGWDSAAHVAVVGAGFLGAEVASAARARGLPVTLIDPLPFPMVRHLGEEIGRRIAAKHRAEGVDLRLGVGVVRVHGGDGRVRGLELTDGSYVECDSLLVAIGADPAVGWLEGSGLTLDNGISCDVFCKAFPGIYAAGDVARWQSPRFGSLRLEHRMNATEQGTVAARNLLGGDVEPFDPIPYFWSDQFDLRLQAHGAFPAGAEIVQLMGDFDDDRMVAGWAQNGTIVGVLGWNAGKQARQARQAHLAPLTPTMA